MARPLRIEFAGATYHVMARGNQGQKICVDDPDREMWLATLVQAWKRTGWLMGFGHAAEGTKGKAGAGLVAVWADHGSTALGCRATPDGLRDAGESGREPGGIQP